MDQANPNSQCVYSRLAGDADLRDIVDLFVAEMPGRIATLLEQFHSANWEDLRRTAHQLKGAAGSYGFDAISPCAGIVEAALRDGEPETQIRASVNELIGLCSRVRSGLPPDSGV
jgi:histidine phosphotransfer protein HptB